MVILKNHPCEQCGTVRYKKTALGEMVCKYGHLLVGWRQEEGDEMAWTGRTRKQDGRKEANKDRGLLLGIEREAATIRIIQYGLQIVSRAFVHDFGFDPSFEHIVRELWLLIVQKSGVDIPDKYTGYHATVPSDIKQAGTASQPLPSSKWESLEEELDLEPFPENDDDDEDDENDYNDAMNSDSDDDDHKAENEPANRKTWPRPRYYDIMVYCYLACLWIRAPVLPSDIYRWCLSYKLPYFKVVSMIPKDLVERLEKVSLSTFLNIPTMAKVYNRILSYRRVLQYQANLVFPEINVPPIMSRLCAQFYLPSEMYYWAQTIFEKLPPPGSMRNTSRIIHTEVRVMASIFILIKMLYILDDEQSEPVFNNERMSDLPPRAIWRKLIKANLERWQQCNEEEILGTETTDVSLHAEFSRDIASYTEKQNNFVRRNALRSRMKAARVKEGVPPRSLIDLFMEPPDLQSAMTTDDKTTVNPTKTHEVGSTYLRSANTGRFYKQLMWYDEYKTSSLLAGEILNIDPERLFISITHLEDGLIRKLREEDPVEMRIYRQKKRQRA